MLGGLWIHVVLGETGLTVVVDELGIVLLLLLLLLLLKLLLLGLLLRLLRGRELVRGRMVLLVMRNWLNKLMIVMSELRKLVLEGGSLVVVESLEIGDILGGEMLLVEGWVGHTGLASCVSGQLGGVTKGGSGGTRAAGDGEDDEGRWVWDRGESEEMTGGTLTWQVRLTDINLRFGGDVGLTTATNDGPRTAKGAREAMVDAGVDDD